MLVRRLVLPLALALVVVAAVALVMIARSSTPDRARRLFATLIPDWQVERTKRDAHGRAAGKMIDGAHSWPNVAQALRALDEAPNDERALRDAVDAVNRVIADAGLRYWLELQRAGDHEVVLTYELVAIRSWRSGDRTIDVRRVRRLDHLNVELMLLGENNSAPVVYLDRAEAELVEALRAPIGKPASEFDALSQTLLRDQIDRWVGEGGARLAAALQRRDERIELMRTHLAPNLELNRPNSVSFGDAWFDQLEPLADFHRHGGPLLLDADLRAARDADHDLQSPPTVALRDRALELWALATEAHETRHALDRDETPPAALLDLLHDNQPDFASAAERELRSYLAELHDAPVPACFVVVSLARSAYGSHHRRTPHYFASRVLLDGIDGGEAGAADPSARLQRLCALGNDDLHRRAAALHQTLYGKPFVPAAPIQNSP